MNYHIQEILAKETHAVRHPILRPGKPIDTCVFNGDELETTFHLGLFINSKIVGVASFLKNSHELLNHSSQYQLRGMAILTEHQGKSLGNRLIEYAELLLKTQNTDLLWCNAREIALNFYIRNGFNVIGEPFSIPEIGIHHVMFKTL